MISVKEDGRSIEKISRRSRGYIGISVHLLRNTRARLRRYLPSSFCSRN